MTKLTSEFLNNDLCFNLRRSVGPLTVFYDNFLERKGILQGIHPKCPILYLLIALKNLNTKVARATDISNVIYCDRSTVNRNMRLPIEIGLIKVIKEGARGQGKAMIFSLSEEGEYVVEKSIPVLKELNENVLTSLLGIKPSSMLSALESIRDNIIEEKKLKK